MFLVVSIIIGKTNVIIEFVLILKLKFKTICLWLRKRENKVNWAWIENKLLKVDWPHNIGLGSGDGKEGRGEAKGIGGMRFKMKSAQQFVRYSDNKKTVE